MRARVISTGAGTIQGDLAYLGGNKNISQIAQARVAADVKFVGQSSCTLQYGNVSSYATATNASCVGPTIVTQNIGTCLTTDVDGPAVTCNNMPAGEYVLMYTVTLGVNAGSQGGLAVTDGSSTVGHINAPYSGAALYNGTIVGRFTYSTAGNRTWTIVGRGFGNTTILYNNVADQNDINLKILYYPTTSEAAVTNEQSAWRIDANIGGANPSLGTAAVNSYTEITDAGLDLVARPGSAPVGIACATTGTSTGGNMTCCRVNEALAVTFTPPYAGYFDVCTNVSPAISGSSQFTGAFQLVEAPNSGAVSVVQEGGERPSAWATAAAGADGGGTVKVCGTFYFGNTSQRTVKLMFEKNAAASATFLYLDRNSSLGQRDMRFTVVPSTSNIARPVLTGDQVTTPNAASPRVYALEFGGASRGTSCTSTPCTLHFNPGNWVTSVTRNSAGNYTVNIPSTTFGSGAYTCTCSTAATSAGCQIFGGTPGATSFNVFGASGADNSLALMCLGLKP